MAKDSNNCTLDVSTDGKSRTITLDDKVVSFGRSRKNTVVLKEDGKISSQHCQVVRGSDGWMLVDLGSKNKTFMNGSSVSTQTLKHGDAFKIGETTVTFRTGAPKAMDPKDAEKMLESKPSSNDAAGAAIAAALSAPAKGENRAKRSSGVREAIRVERGTGRGMSTFAMACFFSAGILSGLTALFVFDGKEKVQPKPVAKIEQKAILPLAGSGEVVVQPLGVPSDPAIPEDGGAKEPEVAVTPPTDPVDTDPVTIVKLPVAPADPVIAVPPVVPADPVVIKPVDPDPVVAVTPKPPMPPPASDDGGTKTPDEVAVKPEPPDDTTAVDDTRPGTQFMGMTTKLRRIVFVMDVTGSMEDPASVTPSEFSGPKDVKISAELKRQLDKFDRKEVKTKLDAAKYELVNSIANLQSDVEFTVIFYSFSPTPWQKKFMVASDKNKIDAMKRIKTTAAWGGTNIFDALEVSFSIIDDHRKTSKLPAGKASAPSKAGYAIFLVTDGRHNTGRFPDPDEFLAEIKKINADGRAVINTVGVGKPGEGVDPPDPVFLARLASDNGGESKMLK